MDGLKIKLYSFTIDCKDPLGLARFYSKMLGWDIVYTDEQYVCIGAPATQQGAYPGILFQRDQAYSPPVWPPLAGQQQVMAHMDFAVNDLEKAVIHATDCGAVAAEKQFSEGWTVMLDPEGHPFCLCQMKELMDSHQFALL